MSPVRTAGLQTGPRTVTCDCTGPTWRSAVRSSVVPSAFQPAGGRQELDRSVAATLDELEARDPVRRTLVVLCGDNGAALPHGKGSLYDPGCHVPFLVRWPGVVKAGSESRVLISGEDLAPTLLAAAALPVPARMTGVSFLPLLKGESFTPRRHLFTERGSHGRASVNVDMKNSGYDLCRAVRSDRYKFI